MARLLLRKDGGPEQNCPTRHWQPATRLGLRGSHCPSGRRGWPSLSGSGSVERRDSGPRDCPCFVNAAVTAWRSVLRVARVGTRLHGRRQLRQVPMRCCRPVSLEIVAACMASGSVGRRAASLLHQAVRAPAAVESALSQLVHLGGGRLLAAGGSAPITRRCWSCEGSDRVDDRNAPLMRLRKRAAWRVIYPGGGCCGRRIDRSRVSGPDTVSGPLFNRPEIS